jgi:hypothetical protein
MADGRTMFRDHIVGQTIPVHTSTSFNGKYEIEVITAQPKDGRKNLNCSEK